MLRIRRILYPTDFSPSASQVLEHALFLAEQHECELHMLHAVVLHDHDPQDPEHRFPEPREIIEHLFRIADTELARLAELHDSSTFSLSQVSRRGFSAAEVILDYAQEIEADLVVMGTHGRRGANRLLLGSVAERVVRQARCPVMTLRERTLPTAIDAVRRLLVPIDFSRHSQLALAHARELAAAYRSSLDLLHVVVEPSYPYFYTPVGGLNVAKHYDELQRRAHRELEQLLAEAPPLERVCQVHVDTGRASSRIVRFAEQHESDMIVMSTHGLSGVERMLVGSTAEEVVRNAGCPVFTVKSFGKSLVEPPPAAAEPVP